MVLSLSAVTALFLAIAIVILANRRPGYSHWRFTISELGEIGASLSHWASWGVFLPVGLSLAYVAVSVKLVAPASCLPPAWRLATWWLRSFHAILVRPYRVLFDKASIT